MHSARMLALHLLLPPVHRCPSSTSDSRVSSHASAERFQGRLDSKRRRSRLRLAQTSASLFLELDWGRGKRTFQSKLPLSPSWEALKEKPHALYMQTARAN
eukprot:scaffold4282_cov112-Cylindrotheca_fusiformis.AAC.6